MALLCTAKKCVCSCLYAIGGCNGQTPLKTVERYSPVTGQWSQVADMNEQHYGVGVGVMNGECLWACMWVRGCMHVCVCVCACMHVCMCVYVRVCVCAHA